jgi:DNA-directed RNA polymerase beta subunit
MAAPKVEEQVMGENGFPLSHIDKEDAWTVIRSYFSQHGLVSQQISSFDRFLNFNVQEIINEIGKVTIDVVPQYVTGKQWQSDKNLVWEVKFG